MIGTLAEIGAMRIQKVLVKDKKQNPKQIASLLKSDLSSLFQNYMELENLEVSFDIENGTYKLSINAKASRIKNFGTLPE